MVVALVALSLALIWLARVAITKTERAATLELDKAHLAATKDAYGARKLQLESDLHAAKAALVAAQESADIAYDALHDKIESELVGANRGDVPAVVSRMLDERRKARLAVSRASGHSAEPASVQGPGAEASSSPTRIDRGD